MSAPRRWRPAITSSTRTDASTASRSSSGVRHRVELNNTLLWHLHDLWPELQLPGGALFSKKWSTRIGRRLARAEQTMRVRIARDELRRLRELTQAIRRLEREITELVGRLAPQLVSQPG